MLENIAMAPPCRGVISPLADGSSTTSLSWGAGSHSPTTASASENGCRPQQAADGSIGGQCGIHGHSLHLSSLSCSLEHPRGQEGIKVLPELWDQGTRTDQGLP